MILEIINIEKKEETKNILVAAYHSPNANLREKWDNITSYLIKVEQQYKC